MKNIYQCKVCLKTFSLLRYLRKHVTFPVVGDHQPNKCQSYYNRPGNLEENLQVNHKIVTENTSTDKINFNTEGQRAQLISTSKQENTGCSKDDACTNIEDELACLKFEPDEKDELYFLNREREEILPDSDKAENSLQRIVSNVDRTQEVNPETILMNHKEQHEAPIKSTISRLQNSTTHEIGIDVLFAGTTEVYSPAETTICKACKWACTSLENLCIHYEALHRLPVVSMARVTTNRINPHSKQTDTSNSAEAVPAVGDRQPNKCQSYSGTTCNLQDNLRDEHKIVTGNLPTDPIDFNTEVHSVQAVSTNIFGNSDYSKDDDCTNIKQELACLKFEPDEEDQLYRFDRENLMLPYNDKANNSPQKSVNNEDRAGKNNQEKIVIEHKAQEETTRTKQTISAPKTRVTNKIRDGSVVVSTPEVHSGAETRCRKCKSACPSLEKLCTHYETLHKLPVVSLARLSTHQINVKCKHTKTSNNEKAVEKVKTNKCDICNKTFTTSNFLKKHKSSAHDGQIFNCNVCQKPFRWLSSLKQHKSSVHEGNRYNCNSCSKKYSNLKCLNRHKSSVHSNVRFRCDVCQKEFKWLENLKQHKLDLHGRVVYKCNNCSKQFNSYRSLRSHKASIHEGVHHKCDMCEKQFSCKRDLKEHKSSSHDGVCYKCDICPKEYSYARGLRRHNAATHDTQRFK